MLIVSDTSPLRYLVEVGVIDVLPRLYGEVLTTPEVLAELRPGAIPHRRAELGEFSAALAQDRIAGDGPVSRKPGRRRSDRIVIGN